MTNENHDLDHQNFDELSRCSRPFKYLSDQLAPSISLHIVSRAYQAWNIVFPQQHISLQRTTWQLLYILATSLCDHTTSHRQRLLTRHDQSGLVESWVPPKKRETCWQLVQQKTRTWRWWRNCTPACTRPKMWGQEDLLQGYRAASM